MKIAHWSRIAACSSLVAGCGGGSALDILPADMSPIDLPPADMPLVDMSRSPDGVAAARRLAFVARDNGINHIYVMNIDAAGLASGAARLTADAESENVPSWSPDGSRLSYQRAFNGAAVYVIGADGTGAQRLSPTPGMDVTPSWSPDGKQLVYAHLDAPPMPNKPPQTDLRIINADGTGDHSILANTKFSVEPRWSVSDTIVFMSLMNGGNLDIYSIKSDGTKLTRLTSEMANHGDPVWSPDGTKITFGSDREGGGKLNVFQINADGTGLVQLTHFDVPDEAGDTNWSTDGVKIAFEYDINGKKQSDPNARAEVWTMNADGSGQTSTRVACAATGCAPRFQPTK